MEQTIDAMQMLDLMVRPGFCVQDHKIVKANQPALSHLIPVDGDVRDLLLTGKEEYTEFQGGCLYLTLCISGQNYGASVTRMGTFDVFLLEQEEDHAQLQAMALAARELREPLNSVMTTAERLFPMTALQEDPALQDQVARMNRGLLQMLRVISNMSDANRYAAPNHQETQNVCSILEEVFSHSAELMAKGSLELRFQNLPSSVYCLVDKEKLERAVLNILSNAMKFTPKGGRIDASLTRRGNMLYLRIHDSGSGIADNLKGSLHSRYQRQPALEDSRYGIGLGMVLIRSAAAIHGGTVLVDQPEGSGTRITMTLSIRQNTDPMMRSPMLRVDYAGERDHGLLEFSETLPAFLYEVK